MTTTTRDESTAAPPQRTVEIPEHLYLRLLASASIWGRGEGGRNAVQDLELLLACGRKSGVY
jgi:hypothetical protein